ncbi:hypothetical protein THRCLA_22703 [Thraustotheca clavata]|uniref:CCHC-type domain-containing protein n=1 Tax=Thraustotheca clavata TaxID=74557 RepID=A0A1V9YUH2_9STRA|nr:hypothetical protein THRCLA_22703 [Thraustotheca clavata]
MTTPTPRHAPFFTAEHHAVIDRILAALTDGVVASLLKDNVLKPDDQKSIVESLTAVVEQQKAEIGRLQVVVNTLQQTIQSAPAPASSPTPVPAPAPTVPTAIPPVSGSSVKLEVPKFGGTESDQLLRWILQVSTAANARQITADSMRTVFAMSYLTGRTVEWAYSRKLSDLVCFPSYQNFLDQLKTTFLPPNSDFRHRTRFLACKQGKRSLREFIQELRFLAASITDEASLPEATRVTVFMNGLNVGAARTQLFRKYPSSFNDAVQIALSEEISDNVANSNGVDPYDMDVNNINKQTPRSKPTCYNCGRPGHYSRQCRAPRKKAGQNDSSTPKKEPRVSIQGNEKSQ